jgi:hypothetical protein
MHFRKKKRIGLAIATALASAYDQTDLADVLTLVEGAVRSGIHDPWRTRRIAWGLST